MSTIFNTTNYLELFNYNSTDNSELIKSSDEDDVLGKMYSFLSVISQLSNSIQNIANKIETNGTPGSLANQLSSLYGSFESNYPTSFQLYDLPIINDKNNKVIDSSFISLLDSAINTYCQEYQTNYTFEKTDNIITLNNLNTILSKIQYNQTFNFDQNQFYLQNSIIAADAVKRFFTFIAQQLQKIKILKWSIYFKQTQFYGKMTFKQLNKIFPKLVLTLNTVKEDPLNYQSNVLASPFARFMSVQQTSTARQSFNLKNILDDSYIYDINSLTDNMLIYTDITENLDDQPTFDVENDVGTNGTFEYFRKITTQTYDLVSRLDDIYEMFDIVSGKQIEKLNVLKAISYIFQLWQYNIKVFQCDYYICHYNCHINGLQGQSAPSLPDMKKYTVQIIVGDYLKLALKYGPPIVDNNKITNWPEFGSTEYNTAINDVETNNLFVIPPYLTSFEYIPDINETTGVDFSLPYIQYIGTIEYNIPVSSKIYVDNIYDKNSTATDTNKNFNFPSSISANIGKNNTDNIVLDFTLSDKYSDLTTSSTADTFLVNDNIISAVGNISVIYNYMMPTVATQAYKSMQIDNLKVYFKDAYDNLCTSISGYIYYDKDFTEADDYATITSNMSNRDNGHSFATYFMPEIALKYSTPNGNTIDIDPDTYGLVVDYRSTDLTGSDRAKIIIYPDDSSPFFGSERTYNYTILPLNTLEISSLTFVADPGPFTETGLPITPSITCYENGNIVQEKMLKIEYFDNTTYGTGKIKITPSLYSDGKYGESYYHGEYTYEFTIDKQELDISHLFTDKKLLGYYNVLIDWNNDDALRSFELPISLTKIPIDSITTDVLLLFHVEAYRDENVGSTDATGVVGSIGAYYVYEDDILGSYITLQLFSDIYYAQRNPKNFRKAQKANGETVVYLQYSNDYTCIISKDNIKKNGTIYVTSTVLDPNRNVARRVSFDVYSSFEADYIQHYVKYNTNITLPAKNVVVKQVYLDDIEIKPPNETTAVVNVVSSYSVDIYNYVYDSTTNSYNVGTTKLSTDTLYVKTYTGSNIRKYSDGILSVNNSSDITITPSLCYFNINYVHDGAIISAQYLGNVSSEVKNISALGLPSYFYDSTLSVVSRYEFNDNLNRTSTITAFSGGTRALTVLQKGLSARNNLDVSVYFVN